MKHFKLTSLSIAALIGVLTANAGYADPVRVQVRKFCIDQSANIVIHAEVVLEEANRLGAEECKDKPGTWTPGKLVYTMDEGFKVTGLYCTIVKIIRCQGIDTRYERLDSLTDALKPLIKDIEHSDEMNDIPNCSHNTAITFDDLPENKYTPLLCQPPQSAD